MSCHRMEACAWSLVVGTNGNCTSPRPSSTRHPSHRCWSAKLLLLHPWPCHQRVRPLRGSNYALHVARRIIQAGKAQLHECMYVFVHMCMCVSVCVCVCVYAADIRNEHCAQLWVQSCVTRCDVDKIRVQVHGGALSIEAHTECGAWLCAVAQWMCKRVCAAHVESERKCNAKWGLCCQARSPHHPRACKDVTCFVDHTPANHLTKIWSASKELV